MAGPIDFASDGPRDEKGPTEFGGVAGLVQPESVDGVAAHVELTSSEKRGVLVRGKAGTVVDELTGFEVADPAADAVDPVTGRVVDPEWNEDGASVGVVDIPPETENP